MSKKCSDTCLTATAHEPKVPFLTMPMDPLPSTSFERRNCVSSINQREGTRVDSWASSAPLVICTAQSAPFVNSLTERSPPTVSLCSNTGFGVQYVHAFRCHCRRNATMPSTRTTKAAMQAAKIMTVGVGVRVGVGLHCPSRRLSPGVLQIHISSPILPPADPSNISN
jgi:hypothetical protein